MDPVTIALICTAVFGTIMVASAFLRQLLISRDKKLNDDAQSRAMKQEAAELEKLRSQMQANQRFEAHYQVLGENKDAIKYVDLQIEEILSKKVALIERYAKAIAKESGAIISSGEASVERKAACDKLRSEIDQELALYDTELHQLQQKRAHLWDAHTDFQKQLLTQERVRNEHLDNIYKQHSALLEKVYIRHIDGAQAVTLKGMEAGSMSFKDMLMAPIQFLMQFFSRGTAVMPNIALVQTRVEGVARENVARVEQDINNPERVVRLRPYHAPAAEDLNEPPEGSLFTIAP